MERMKRRVALVLVMAMLLSVVPVFSGAPVQAQTLGKNDMEDGFLVSEMVGDGLNGEGVWVTEVYNNDVNRSRAEDTRVSGGYVPITVYDTTSDLMEFLEVVSTHDEPIAFNDLYEITVANRKLTVTTMDGSSDVILTRDQVVVLWHYRTDLTVKVPTEAEFRAAMKIPEDALLLKCTDGTGWDPTGTVSVRDKTTGETTCTFTTEAGVHVSDGHSVELRLPLMGSTMEAYRVCTMPTPGIVTLTQVRGLMYSDMDETTGKGLYITEIRPNDISRSAQFGLGNDLMECIEVTNTTDRAVDLNNDYKIVYALRNEHRKILQIRKYSASATNHEGSASGCTVPAGGTAVLWCYRYSHLSNNSKFPTEADLRTAYSIPGNVPVYIFSNQDSFNDTQRTLQVFRADGAGLGDLVSSYTYQGESDVPDNTSVHLKIDPWSPEMQVYKAAGTTSMGTVESAQLTFTHDYNDAVKMRLAEGQQVPEYILQGEDLRVDFWYDYNTRTKRIQSRLDYRFDGEGEWIKAQSGECGIRFVNLFEAVIPGYELFDHDYVEFYVTNRNEFRDTICGIYRVDIRKLNEVDGIRTNISEGERVKGTVSITANDGGTNASTKIWVDGGLVPTTRMPEDGAYLSFLSSGIDDYFRTVLTDAGNGVIKDIGKWQYVNQKGQVVHIDNSYFTYAGGKYNVTLRIWAGTWGASSDEYLSPKSNRDDFTISRIQLKLPNGKSYLPTKIGPTTYNGVDTSAKTNTSTALDAVHNVGDASKTSAYLEMTFSIPEADVNAVGARVDTTKLGDGTHTLKISDGTDTKTVTFVVDNTAPVVDPGVAQGATLSGELTIVPKVTEPGGLRSVAVLLDGKAVEVPYETSAYALGQGSHTLEVMAEDMAGNVTTKTVTFEVDGLDMEVLAADAKDITWSDAQLYLKVRSDTAAEATFYKAQKLEAGQIQTGTMDGLVPYIRYTIDVSDAGADDLIRVDWDGTASGADATHATTMFVRDVATGGWVKIGRAGADGAIREAVFPVEGHAEDGVATVIVQCTAESAVPDLDTVNDGVTGNDQSWNGYSVPEGYDFSFAWITDTQYYAQTYQYHNMDQNRWIVDNAEAWKIRYVLHTGDIVDDWDAVYQWENADQAAKIFDDAGMPYGVLPGNHDVASGLNLTQYYYQYFPEERFASQPTYGGSYKNNYGHYDLISENGQDFVIIYMGWCMYQEELDWMNEVLAKYSDRKAILCFHGYTAANSSVDGLLDYWGVLVRDHVVKKNPNVFAVLNGHYAGASYQTVRFDDDGDGKLDRTVYQICNDYQSVTQGGLEYIKFLYFNLDNDKVFVNSYSPYMDDFNYYDNTSVDDLTALAKTASNGVVNKLDVDILTMDVDFSVKSQTILEDSFSATILTDEVLGTAPVDADSQEATLKLEGLEPGMTYRWYAVVENEASGVLTTQVYTFATEAEPVHDYEVVVTPPTCTEDGYTTHTCRVCGVSFVTDEVPASGHDYDVSVVPPTCTEDGYTTYTCRVCGESFVSDEVPASGHDYDVSVVPPSCTEDGYTTHICRVCGVSFVTDEVPASGHDYDVSVVPPTCEEAGRTEHVCKGCGDSYVTDPVPALGHSFGAWIQSKPATCTEQGELSRICGSCGKVETGLVAALGHSYQSVVTVPTCTQAGYITYTCSGCGHSYTGNALPATGHSYENGTCTACGQADPEAVKDPGLVLNYPTLSFEDEIIYNVYFSVKDMTSVVEMGLMVLPKMDQNATIADAVALVPGYVTNGVVYLAKSEGIPAANMGDTLYFKVYAKLTDGSYAYSTAGGYNAKAYANSILKGNNSDEMKALVVSMLNYGAEAQKFFDHNVDKLVNNALTAEQQALVTAYDATMMDAIVKADSSKTTNFVRVNSNFRQLYPSVSFDGAFAINFYCAPAVKVDDGMTLYYWDMETMASVDKLTVENATGSMEMTDTNGMWWGQVAGIAAKEMDDTYYVSCVFESGGETITTGVIPYSLGKYCSDKAAADGDAQQSFAQATAVYGYYAKAYFASIA